MVRKTRRRTRKRHARKKGGANPDRTYVFMVPYRARLHNDIRKKEVKALIDNVKEYFTKHNKKFKIVVVEQNNDLDFNPGKVRNIGFLEAEKDFASPNNIYIHINCDYLIDKEKPFPKELEEFNGEGFLDIFNIGAGMGDCIGGCAAFGAESFKKINGFPNNLFGWGAEDTIIKTRADAMGVPRVVTPLLNNGWIIDTGGPNYRNFRFNESNKKKGVININSKKTFLLKNGISVCEYTVDGDGEHNDPANNVIHRLVNFADKQANVP